MQTSIYYVHNYEYSLLVGFRVIVLVLRNRTEFRNSFVQTTLYVRCMYFQVYCMFVVISIPVKIPIFFQITSSYLTSQVYDRGNFATALTGSWAPFFYAVPLVSEIASCIVPLSSSSKHTRRSVRMVFMACLKLYTSIFSLRYPSTNSSRLW